VANEHASRLIADQLYRPQIWAQNPTRRVKTGVPGAVTLQVKTASGLGLPSRVLKRPQESVHK
jgi:SRSO17 transposase